jgi:peptidoglycan/LPS O-acetylase OafA/YrhL
MSLPALLGPLPLPRSPRYVTLDFWRGLACLFVVILHSAHYANEDGAATDSMGKAILFVISKLGVGVPIFFVISGYCISATCDSARRKACSPGQYFYRRFRRILPPYWIAMLLCAGLAVFLTLVGRPELVGGDYGKIPHPQELSLIQWLGNISLTETWRANFIGGPENKVVGPAWTLCYEEQFYAVCGVLLFLCPRWFFGGTALVSVLVCGTTVISSLFGQPITHGLFIDGRWLLFAEGILLYCLINYPRHGSLGVGIFACLLLLVSGIRWGCPFVRNDAYLRDRAFECVASSIFAMGLFLLHPWDKCLSTVRLLCPISFCGQMCYSLYLVHWPIVVVLTNAFYHSGIRSVWGTLLVTLPVCLAVSLATSWVFHVFVEQRFINHCRRSN